MPAHANRTLDLYNLFGFHRLIRNVTPETLESATLIDHIATTNKSNVAKAGVHGKSISDYYLVYCVRNCGCASKTMHKNIASRQMKAFNQEDFLSDLLQLDWKGTRGKRIVFQSGNINFFVEQWTLFLKNMPPPLEIGVPLIVSILG